MQGFNKALTATAVARRNQRWYLVTIANASAETEFSYGGYNQTRRHDHPN